MYNRKVTDTRHALMEALLPHKGQGLTIEELSSALDISRNAVQQHVSNLERDGLIEPKGQRASGGRPSRTYALSEKGYESFPRNYALLAQTMLETARAALGDEAVEGLLMKMADDLADNLRPRLDKLPPGQRLAEVVQIMNELGYEAAPSDDAKAISAVNCIYHKLAQQTRAICRFDVRLLSLLLDHEIDHTSCMATGDGRCHFQLEAD
jgi:DeoR family suf operon transcriptional repressor